MLYTFQLPLEVRLETLFGNITEVRDFSASFLASLEEHQHSAAHGVSRAGLMSSVSRTYAVVADC